MNMVTFNPAGTRTDINGVTPRGASISVGHSIYDTSLVRLSMDGIFVTVPPSELRAAIDKAVGPAPTEEQKCSRCRAFTAQQENPRPLAPDDATDAQIAAAYRAGRFALADWLAGRTDRIAEEMGR